VIMMRTERETNELARERATRRSPPPVYDPVHAGWLGAALTGFIIMTFMALAGIPDGANPWRLAPSSALASYFPTAICEISSAFTTKHGSRNTQHCGISRCVRQVLTARP
jgi:hypothetical protein